MWETPGAATLCAAERQGNYYSRGVVVYRRGFFLQKDFRAFTSAENQIDGGSDAHHDDDCQQGFLSSRRAACCAVRRFCISGVSGCDRTRASRSSSAGSENVAIGCAKVAQGLHEFFFGFAQAEHDARLRVEFAVTAFLGFLEDRK